MGKSMKRAKVKGAAKTHPFDATVSAKKANATYGDALLMATFNRVSSVRHWTQAQRLRKAIWLVNVIASHGADSRDAKELVSAAYKDAEKQYCELRGAIE